ncbi:MAG: succinate dehydrogenase [Thermoproteus sp.]|jgi:succinate dehydrogenase / fumarate reductase cytochrome b subunit|nr:succinate dehydrogenase [Thermoproteus sp.]
MSSRRSSYINVEEGAENMRAGKGAGEWFRLINYERLYFAIQRISGLYMFFYLIFYRVLFDAFVSPSLVSSFDMTVPGKVLAALFLVFLAFHGLNGFRIMLIEFGIIKGWPLRHPIRNVPGLRRSRIHLIYNVLMIIIAVAALVYLPYLVTYGAVFRP